VYTYRSDLFGSLRLPSLLFFSGSIINFALHTNAVGFVYGPSVLTNISFGRRRPIGLLQLVEISHYTVLRRAFFLCNECDVNTGAMTTYVVLCAQSSPGLP
jgi:hypothetical protein